MKNKFLMPALAILIAMASAFATPITNQMGWYNDDGVAVEGTITTPSSNEPLCSAIPNGSVCKIRVGTTDHDAYATEEDAQFETLSGLLRYE
ncbi:MAG TPA: DUF6520 family protein [Ohtaekwangia sp.]|jgi:hypothetical protein|nr:DUF6520 family protein [Ohtaekwangia sp.]